MTRTLGVSLKMYFGYDQTLRWSRTVADLLGNHPALVAGDVRLFLLPSFPALPAVAGILRGTPITAGAQNLAAADSGAWTGEVSGVFLREAGARYVEVGHAERRTHFGETEEVVADKTAAALRAGLTPVLCLGERDRMPVAQAVTECRRQLIDALQTSRRFGLGGSLILAYEPFWAIGAAQPASDEHITGVCTALRDTVAQESAHPDSSVIYGGSAGPGLATRLGGGVDGLFLGRFAHDPEALVKVVEETAARA
ncbi:triose-phosphate isomerase family protein [Actinoplanes derwentensis]|uniref:Triosephosphate isomerase n=1 Tax=Actinoplanes derwentensis TaxID=113562 RepID=A0A1H1ZVJ3_9ACTN|nr:triose-phosphate isomerase family protein [Actinoplanes derwentensis]GID83543.1 triosephosphate isomerase [Actinoplanes derwentensis]SDT37276.1 triosephosphate isomerase [Actinoplanes derwentensis]